MASMNRKPLILSSAGLKNIVPNNISTDNDFLFIFGDKEVRTSKIKADFISPLISQIHLSDPTIEMYKYPSDEIMKAIFSESNLYHFQNICSGNEVIINEEERKNLQKLSILLWNEELFKTINEIFGFDKKELETDELLYFVNVEYLNKHGKSSNDEDGRKHRQNCESLL